MRSGGRGLYADRPHTVTTPAQSVSSFFSNSPPLRGLRIFAFGGFDFFFCWLKSTEPVDCRGSSACRSCAFMVSSEYKGVVSQRSFRIFSSTSRNRFFAPSLVKWPSLFHTQRLTSRLRCGTCADEHENNYNNRDCTFTDWSTYEMSASWLVAFR